VILAPFTMLLAWSIIGELRHEAKYQRVLKRYRRRYERSVAA
jgi:hypothetical protein